MKDSEETLSWSYFRLQNLKLGHFIQWRRNHCGTTYDQDLHLILGTSHFINIQSFCFSLMKSCLNVLSRVSVLYITFLCRATTFGFPFILLIKFLLLKRLEAWKVGSREKDTSRSWPSIWNFCSACVTSHVFHISTLEMAKASLSVPGKNLQNVEGCFLFSSIASLLAVFPSHIVYFFKNAPAHSFSIA